MWVGKLRTKVLIKDWHKYGNTLAPIGYKTWRIRKSRGRLTGHYWSDLDKILVNIWNKYEDLNNYEYSHSIEVVFTTTPQVITKHKIWKWKDFKYSEKGCKSRLKILISSRKSRKVHNAILKYCKYLQNGRFGSILTRRKYQNSFFMN